MITAVLSQDIDFTEEMRQNEKLLEDFGYVDADELRFEEVDGIMSLVGEVKSEYAAWRYSLTVMQIINEHYPDLVKPVYESK